MSDEITVGEMYDLRRKCETEAVGGLVSVPADKLLALIASTTKLRSDAQKLHGVCYALGIEPPAFSRPDYGSGLAGGSALEAQQQHDWDTEVRRRVFG